MLETFVGGEHNIAMAMVVVGHICTQNIMITQHYLHIAIVVSVVVNQCTLMLLNVCLDYALQSQCYSN